MEISTRRYLSEADEKEALQILRDLLRHQNRVTSDDIRLAVRSVASKGGSIAIPSDFPPSRWVLKFKRVHGFIQPNSFVYGGGVYNERTAFALPDRLEVGRPDVLRTGTGSRSCSRPLIAGSLGSEKAGSGDEKERGLSRFSHCSLEDVGQATARQAFEDVTQNHTKMQTQMHAYLELELQRNIQRRHCRHQQQHQQRLMIVDGRRGTRTVQPREGEVEREELRLNAALESTNATVEGSSINRIHKPGSVASRAIRGGTADEVSDNTAIVPSDKRGYKSSHTVSAETWEKAIAAVEEQGMSLRAAAKVYRVHFAALYRRVKKRAQGGQSEGMSNGYFHPSDEAGIVHVVVTRAELGVLMTFNELLALVEASALQKLPDISVESARKLLTHFQSRNEQSIRHIIEDWPLSQPASPASAAFSVLMSSSASVKPPSQQAQLQHQEYPAYGLEGPPRVNDRRVLPEENTRCIALTNSVALTELTPGLRMPPSHVDRTAASVGNQDVKARKRLAILISKTMNKRRVLQIPLPQYSTSTTFLEELPHPPCEKCIQNSRGEILLWTPCAHFTKDIYLSN